MRYKIRKNVTAIALLIALCACTLFSSSIYAQAASASYDDIVALNVLCEYDMASEQLSLMNEKREAAGAEALEMDSELQAAAMQRAAELALNFSHTRPDGTVYSTISSAAVGENIAGGYTSAASVTSSWMNSSVYKANMLNANYTSVGIGCVYVGSLAFWVQLFGTTDADGISGSGSTSVLYTVYTDYDTVSYTDSGFNLDESSSDLTLLSLGDTYQLTVGILNAGWSGRYAGTDSSGYSWSSSDSSVLTVDDTGLVTAVGSGNASITATSAGGYVWTKKFSVNELSSATITLSKTSYTYNGKIRKPSVTVICNGKTLTKGTDYTVSYDDGRTEIGKYKVIIQGKGDYSGTVTKTFKIKPAKVNLSSVKTSGSKAIKVKWSKSSGSVKYQISYRVKGTSKWKTVNAGKNKVSKKISGLKKGKTYQVRIRAYKTVGGSTYTGSWSKVKTVKVK